MVHNDYNDDISHIYNMLILIHLQWRITAKRFFYK